MKICIVTGGSGGHIYPAITFADYARDKGHHEVVFIGNSDRMEADIVPQHKYDFFAISNQGLQGSIVDKIKAVLGQYKAIKQAKALLLDIKPDVVFAFGGYVTLPVVMAAHKLGIKVALHEQNALVGKANKMASRYADIIFTSYETSFNEFKNTKFYGNPRSALDEEVDRHDLSEIKRLNLDPNKRIVLCVMGSQGSTAMNTIFKAMIESIDTIEFQVIVVTGKVNYEDFIKDLEAKDGVIVQPFVNQALLLNHIDLIVARSGASTITEIASFALPSILIPSPYVANNHQYYNAKALLDKKATVLLEEKDLDGVKLLAEISSLLNDENRKNELIKNVEQFKTPDVNANILKDIEALV